MVETVVLLICFAIECLFLIVQYVRTKKQKREIEKSLYKFLEERVLNLSLQHRITSEQAALSEYQKLFLCVDFLDTKPHMMHIFSLEECITIGRNQSNIICIRDSKLSRVHCKISLIQGRLYLQDLGSANGTILKRGILKKIHLTANKAEELFQEDIIVVGNYRMRIHTYYGREARM